MVVNIPEFKNTHDSLKDYLDELLRFESLLMRENKELKNRVLTLKQYETGKEEMVESYNKNSQTLTEIRKLIKEVYKKLGFGEIEFSPISTNFS